MPNHVSEERHLIILEADRPSFGFAPRLAGWLTGVSGNHPFSEDDAFDARRSGHPWLAWFDGHLTCQRVSGFMAPGTSWPAHAGQIHFTEHTAVALVCSAQPPEALLLDLRRRAEAFTARAEEPLTFTGFTLLRRTVHEETLPFPQPRAAL